MLSVFPKTGGQNLYWANQVTESIRWWVSWGDAFVYSIGHTIALIVLFVTITTAGMAALVTIGILNVWHKLR